MPSRGEDSRRLCAGGSGKLQQQPLHRLHRESPPLCWLTELLQCLRERHADRWCRAEMLRSMPRRPQRSLTLAKTS
ncbi:MAG: hypothetical protein RIT24_1103, partial [Planctomycetota bacterium]